MIETEKQAGGLLSNAETRWTHPWGSSLRLGASCSPFGFPGYHPHLSSWYHHGPAAPIRNPGASPEISSPSPFTDTFSFPAFYQSSILNHSPDSYSHLVSLPRPQISLLFPVFSVLSSTSLPLILILYKSFFIFSLEKMQSLAKSSPL